MNQNHEFVIEDSIWDLFVKFFREVKGYENWTDDEIELSYNGDDVAEFVAWLSEETTENPVVVVISAGEK